MEDFSFINKVSLVVIHLTLLNTRDQDLLVFFFFKFMSFMSI